MAKLTFNPIIINITDTNYFNRMLKRIAKKSGAFNDISTYINARGKEVTEPQYKRIKSHSGRHTFITKWSSILSPQEIIFFTGHADTDCIENNYLHRTENVINSQLSRITNKLIDANNNQQSVVNHNDISTTNINSNVVIAEIKALREELTSPMIKENELYKELFSDDEKYDRIADLALLNDMENVRKDFEEEG